MVSTYPGTKTWTGSEVLDSADMNTYVRDNVAWSMTDRPRLIRTPRETAQGITSGSVETVTMIGNDVVIPFGGWGSDATYVEIPVDGYYDITGSVTWEGNITGYRHLRINVNGSYALIDSRNAHSSASARLYQNISHRMLLSATDQVGLAVYHNAGTEISINSSAAPAHFAVTYLCQQGAV